MASDIPLQSFPFNSWISDEDLRAVMAPAEIVRIERGSWKSFVEFRSDEEAHVIEERLEAWFENRRAEESERHRREQDAIYEATAAKLWDGVPGIPSLLTRRGKPTLTGYYFIDDGGQSQYIFPEDQIGR